MKEIKVQKANEARHGMRSNRPCSILCSIVSVAAVLQLILALPAAAQSASWNLKPRETAENANSHAMNLLEKGPNNPKYKTAVDDAVAILLKGTAADPTDPLPLATLGLALDMKGRFEEGLDALRRSYQLDSKRQETLLDIGVTYYLCYSYDQAIDALTRDLKADPRNCDLHCIAGYAFMRKGDLSGAAEQFHQTIDCHPGSALAYEGLAYCAYLNGNISAATQASQHSYSIEPYKTNCALSAELDYLRLGSTALREPLARLNKSLKAPVRSMTAIGYIKQHDFHWDPVALGQFDNGTLISLRSLEPPKAEAKQTSAGRSGNTAKIVDQVQQLATTYQNDFYLEHELALIQLATGSYDAAATAALKAISLCQQDKIDYLYASRAYWLGGKKQQAADMVRKFQESCPDQAIAPIFLSIAQSAGPAASATPAAPPNVGLQGLGITPATPNPQTKPAQDPNGGF